MGTKKRGEKAAEPFESVELTISGQVQRVGYRRVVMRAARKHGISGYVKNQRDDTVRVVAEGGPASIRAFISDISIKREPILVENVEVKRRKPAGRHRGFALRSGRLVDELQEGLGTWCEQLAQLTDEFRARDDGLVRRRLEGVHGEEQARRSREVPRAICQPMTR